MRLIFAGTPDFAAVALEALIRAGHEIALVLSQPDRPSGRGMKLTASPVKTLALQHGLPVLTPQTLSLKRDPEGAAAVHETLRNLEADVLIVAAYGLILPAPVLECAKGIGRDRDIRAINIHGSLLPRWRGAGLFYRAGGPAFPLLPAPKGRALFIGGPCGAEGFSPGSAGQGCRPLPSSRRILHRFGAVPGVW